MSDIRVNRWLHQSGTGGVYQDSSGRVGIGTSVPTSALDVQSGTIKIGSNTLSSSGVSTFSQLNVGTGGTVITTTVNGLVGIGTTNPNRQFHINGTGTLGTQLQINGTTDSAGIKFIPATGNHYEIQANASSQWFVYDRTNDAYRFVIDGSCNIGVNNSNFAINSTLRSEYSSTSPPKIMFDTAYSNAQTDAQLKLYIFNSGLTRQGFGAGPAYDLQYHCSGAAADNAKHRFYTDNVLRMVIDDASQSVTKPTQPAFLAYSTGVSVSGGWVNLSSSLTTEVYDIAGNYGTSTAGRFVAPIAGRYLFYFGGFSTGNTIDARYAVCAIVNGGSFDFISGGNYSSLDTPLSGYSVVHNLSANDYVELYYYTAIATTWGAASHKVYWGGYLLG